MAAGGAAFLIILGITSFFIYRRFFKNKNSKIGALTSASAEDD